jgi:hypothetical protein
VTNHSDRNYQSIMDGPQATVQGHYPGLAGRTHSATHVESMVNSV